MPKERKQWFKLDNAGKVFPGQKTETWSNMFRLSVILKEAIQPEVLETALEQVMPRFPVFNVRLRRGFFWYYLEKNSNAAPPLLEDVSNPAYRIDWKANKGFLFRVYYYRNRISVDFFHAISDGYGAGVFLNTLTAQYLRLLGHDIPNGYSVLDIYQKATAEEMEDAFQKVPKSRGKIKGKGKFAYQIRSMKLPKHAVNITTGFMPVDVLKEKAKEKGATITEYLAAHLLYTMYLHQQENVDTSKKMKTISVQIPVNLRNTFKVYTFRNFSLNFGVRIDPNLGKYTFDEVLLHIIYQLRDMNNEKQLSAMVTSNLKLETNPFMRALPLRIKDLGIGIAFEITGEKTSSAVLSNIGVIKIPKEMEKFVEDYLVMSGPGKRNGTRCGAGSFNNRLALTFSNIYDNVEIERMFFSRLVEIGIPVEIQSNR